MNASQNHITLIGNMGSNAQVTQFENGAKVARFRLATGHGTSSQWHRIFAWGNMATFIEQYGEKGKQLAIHGRSVERTYTGKDGDPKKYTEVEIKHVIGL